MFTYLKHRLLGPEQIAWGVEAREVRGSNGEGVCFRTSALKPWVHTLSPGLWTQVCHLPQPREFLVWVEDTEDQVGLFGGGALREQETVPLLTAGSEYALSGAC